MKKYGVTWLVSCSAGGVANAASERRRPNDDFANRVVLTGQCPLPGTSPTPPASVLQWASVLISFYYPKRESQYGTWTATNPRSRYFGGPKYFSETVAFDYAALSVYSKTMQRGRFISKRQLVLYPPAVPQCYDFWLPQTSFTFLAQAGGQKLYQINSRTQIWPRRRGCPPRINQPERSVSIGGDNTPR